MRSIFLLCKNITLHNSKSVRFNLHLDWIKKEIHVSHNFLPDLLPRRACIWVLRRFELQEPSPLAEMAYLPTRQTKDAFGFSPLRGPRSRSGRSYELINRSWSDRAPCARLGFSERSGGEWSRTGPKSLNRSCQKENL
jgi:hypothetical protein